MSASIWDFKPASTPARFDQRDNDQAQLLDNQNPLSASKLRDMQPSLSPFGFEKKSSGWNLNGQNGGKATSPSGMQSRYSSLSTAEDGPVSDLESDSCQDFVSRFQQLKHIDSYKNNLIEVSNRAL